MSQRQGKLLAILVLKKEFLQRSTRRHSKADFSGNVRERDGRISGEEMRRTEEIMKDRRNAQMQEGRGKVTADCDVTRMAVSRSRTSEMEPELLSADVDDRRVTEDAAVAGRGFRSEGNGGVCAKT